MKSLHRVEIIRDLVKANDVIFSMRGSMSIPHEVATQSPAVSQKNRNDKEFPQSLLNNTGNLIQANNTKYLFNHRLIHNSRVKLRNDVYHSGA